MITISLGACVSALCSQSLSSYTLSLQHKLIGVLLSFLQSVFFGAPAVDDVAEKEELSVLPKRVGLMWLRSVSALSTDICFRVR